MFHPHHIYKNNLFDFFDFLNDLIRVFESFNRFIVVLNC